MDGSGIKLSESVCWRGKPLTGNDDAGVLEIIGGDCGECHVGRTCHFQLLFHHPTPFKLIGHTTSHPDLMITLTGEDTLGANESKLAKIARVLPGRPHCASCNRPGGGG